jgi:hypothetical protein
MVLNILGKDRFAPYYKYTYPLLFNEYEIGLHFFQDNNSLQEVNNICIFLQETGVWKVRPELGRKGKFWEDKGRGKIV